jgi:paraquat-inducible protein B
MSQRTSSTLIGAFVVGAIALAITAFLLLGNIGIFEDREKAIMYFTGSVEGLNKGAPVNIRGVKIGTVIDIDVEFHPLDGEFFIPVIVQFEPDAVEIVRQLHVPDPDEGQLEYMIEELGLRARLQLQSILTSQMAIQLDYYPDTEVQYHGDGILPEIPTIPTPIEKLNEQLQKLPVEQILNDITSSLAAIHQIVSSPEVMETIKALNKTLRTIDELASNINVNLQPLADNTNRTLQSVDQLANNVNRNVQPLADNSSKVLLDAQQTLREASALLTSTKQLLNEDSTQIYNLNIALEEIVNAARSIRIFAETIERQPETLLKGKNPQD